MSAAKGFGRGLKFDLPAAGVAPAAAPARAAEPATGLMRTVGIAQDLHALRAQVQQLQGERGAQPLDAKLIQPSRWANRHESSFASPEFEAFKAEIADAGGNVQPIKVRPLAGEQGDGARYELVFGHRRHRACLDLGLPVLAVVQETDERGLWVEMERENRGRANLSAWEQGAMYRRALDAGLFPSLRMLAQAIGRDQSDVSKAVRIAQLPDEVVKAFRSPIDIQFQWATGLTAALEKDATRVLRRARDPAVQGMSAREVLEWLIGGGEGSSLTQPQKQGEGSSLTPPKRLDLGHGRHVEVRAKGERVTLELDAALIGPDGWAALEKALQKIAKGAARG